MGEKEVASLTASTQDQPLPRWVVWYDSHQPGPRFRALRKVLLAAWLVLAILMLSRHLTSHTHSEERPYVPHGPHNEQVIAPALSTTTKKVPLEAHIMSKCPDAKDCLQKLVLPAMEQIHDKVDFKLSYIGSYSNSSDAVECKHGPPECLGNMILLCAAKLYPSPIIHLGFANCLISDYQKIPNKDLIQGCALEHGVDFDKVNKCISDEGEGIDLLRDSFERSAEAGVKYSCTVRLDEEIRCIRDGGEWKDCKNGSDVEDLVKDVDALYKQWNDED